MSTGLKVKLGGIAIAVGCALILVSNLLAYQSYQKADDKLPFDPRRLPDAIETRISDIKGTGKRTLIGNVVGIALVGVGGLFFALSVAHLAKDVENLKRKLQNQAEGPDPQQ